ncbi:MAG TPA: sugar phosphate isomerase/epimerase [Verrucomicrobiae bacterium]|nr:sugar phosphate isomerase/epimerase [Verrucomicrobiae bacterium]
MSFTRRGFVGAAMLAARQALAQQGGQAQDPQQAPVLKPPDRHRPGPKPRGTPAVCMYGDQLLKINYEDVAPMIRPLGFEGVELMAQPGGHIEPEHADLHLERAIESMTGNGVDVWCMSTSFTSPNDPTMRLALEWSGEMGIPMVRPGHWIFADSDLNGLNQAFREISILSQMARQTGTTIVLHNGTTDESGVGVWQSYSLILARLDPHLVGYDFDIGNAAAIESGLGWQAALNQALPRVRMVTAHDCRWTTDNGARKLIECPLGEGIVDWPKFLAELAKHNFVGPISLHVAYGPRDEFSALRKDVQFLKKQLATAYGG